MDQNRPFKNTYVIDMDKLLNKPFSFMPNGALLPIEQENGKPSAETQKLFSERFAKKMVKEYPNLSPVIGTLAARTIIEYLDINGEPIVTLYPTNDADLHKNDWTNIDNRVLPEMQDIIEQRKRLVNAYIAKKMLRK